MYLSEIQKKEIINIDTGKKIGTIIDVIVSEDGQIKSLLLEEKNRKKFSIKEEYEVKWNKIIKIGDDIILIGPSTYNKKENWQTRNRRTKNNPRN